MNKANAEVIHIDNEETQKLLEQGVPLIDVRTISEWRETGIIEGSHLITFFDEQGRYNVDTWLGQLNEVAGPDEPFMLICAVGGRTRSISQALSAQLGYQSVYNVRKGISHWLSENRPVKTYQP